MILNELQALNSTQLTPIIRTVLNDKTVDITDWKSRTLHGGTLGKVYVLSGNCGHDTQEATISWSLILKIQKQYPRFGDPESWRREMLAYQSNLFDQLPESLKVPRCYGIEEKNDEIWLWLEHVSGNNGTNLSLADYAQAARHLAHFQGSFLVGRPIPSHPWLSTNYWLVNNISLWGTKALPWLQKEHMHPELTKRILQLWAGRDKLLDILYTLPRTVCHRDFHAGNIFVPVSECTGGNVPTIVIDWDCAGIGVIGEDIADLVGEALVYYEFDPAQAVELQEAILTGYIMGLREGGWKGDDKLIRLGYSISLAFHWCFRIICLIQKTENLSARQGYVKLLHFMLDQTGEINYT